MRNKLIILILIIICLAIAWKPNYKDDFHVEIPDYPDPIGEEVFDYFNEWRMSNRMAAVQKSDNLCLIAKYRSEEVQSDFSHTGFINTKESRYEDNPHFVKMGENLSRWLYTPKDIINSWEKSPTHYAIMSYPFSHGCVECKEDKCVMILAKWDKYSLGRSTTDATD